MSILDSFSLKGRTALVTGASAGLGRWMSEGLAEAGADVAIVARSERLAETEARIREIGRDCLALPCDLAEESAVTEVVDATIERFGNLDILVNNAGITFRAPAEDYPVAEWDRVVGLNQRSLFLLAQAAGRHMLKRGRGKIVNVASLICFIGGKNIVAYTASKSAVAGITRSLANEWASRGVHVNAIAPGYFLTDMTQALFDDPEREPEITARIPAGRWGGEDDIKGAAVFLASDASDFVHGQLLVVDGGWLAR